MKNSPIAVRLDDDQDTAIKHMAERFRVKEIDVIRWAVDALIEYVKIHDGHMHLPIDFGVFWQAVERRALAHSKPLASAHGTLTALASTAEDPASYKAKRKAE
jgi:hypothetical protein